MKSLREEEQRRGCKEQRDPILHAGAKKKEDAADTVITYTNKDGERVLRIVNLIQTMERTPEKVETVISVRTLSSVDRNVNIGVLENLCIFCDSPVDTEASSLLCTQCLQAEPQKPVDTSSYYSFF
ncbi:hypothetical protein NEPAR06_0222 [Nematocida parisii]|uniref:Uncharacterized protein n=1 Tax=Nematocida parisii (strain ERTm3) TaxID=935791 RepID=I3EDA9_NEMP3|nr:uncharacterized protein NEPG_00620 [Nematocida parisii ERTm1]EIJ87206.1 hypothetical protein NEQG_02541 [Nematocida parisii ERTm3]KAI5126591.1 hypothetical protein NEPAR08_0510 [Nematocida parisii]EIJ95095.1 hypothetical protein NEPG_00620 [Nematocida parisii ERTm1]KAI5127874.1 hypothetical protein NEPAR03_1154 [Nematocida parisii]KAI5143187.1 hypothetical protein NEPAR07_0549 [Nematocida parisii]|eukprot:XP_013058451.1 hypothetical protein NEPG_00620 [Nematocida parisii ERTm1]